MIVVEHKQIELDYCTKCRGVWFDEGELELMLEKNKLGGPPHLPEAESSEEKRKCPVCGRKMKKVLAGQEPRLIIDACPEEEGLWFDGGEVNQLIKQLVNQSAENDNGGEGVGNFLKDVFRAGEE
jgi:Zn-finger nucleic acid-binding protein